MLGIKYIRFKIHSDYCEYKKLREEVRNDTRLLDKIKQNNIACGGLCSHSFLDFLFTITCCDEIFVILFYAPCYDVTIVVYNSIEYQ